LIALDFEGSLTALRLFTATATATALATFSRHAFNRLVAAPRR
jgi:hypothetical protein